jgi:hypothetical protein
MPAQFIDIILPKADPPGRAMRSPLLSPTRYAWPGFDGTTQMLTTSHKMKKNATTPATLIEVYFTVTRPNCSEESEFSHFATSTDAARAILVHELAGNGWKMDEYEVQEEATSSGSIAKGLREDGFFTVYIYAPGRHYVHAQFNRVERTPERLELAQQTRNTLANARAIAEAQADMAAELVATEPAQVEPAADLVAQLVDELPSNQTPRAFVQPLDYSTAGAWVPLAYYTDAAHFAQAWPGEVGLFGFANVPRLIQAEYGGLSLLINYSQALRQTPEHDREAFAAFIESQDSAQDLAESCPTVAALLALFRKKYRGYFGRPMGSTDQESLADFLEDQAGHDWKFNTMPDRYRLYIDWERAANDCEINRQYYATQGHIFEF